MNDKPRKDDIYRQDKNIEQLLVLLTSEDAQQEGIEVPGLNDGYALVYEVFYANRDPEKNPGRFRVLNGELKAPGMRRYERAITGERARRLKDYASEVLSRPETLRREEANRWLDEQLRTRLLDYLG